MQRRQEEPDETTLKSENYGERGEQQRGLRTGNGERQLKKD